MLDYSLWIQQHIFLFLLIVIWTGVWKLLALWKSARKNSPVWFIVLGLLNTLGILEILYLFVFSKMKRRSRQEQASSKPRRRRR